MSDNKKNKSGFFRFVAIASTVGINMVVTTFVGFAVGYWLLDESFNTFPVFTIIFFLLGIVAGFVYLFKIAKRAGEHDEEEE